MLNNQRTARDDKTDKGYASFSTRPGRFPKPPKITRPSINLSRTARPVLLAGVCLILGLAGGWLGARAYTNDATRSVSTAAKQRYVSNESELIAEIAQTVGQSVVSVTVENQVSTPNIFGFAQTQQRVSAGTGFIISPDGIIMTNRHVVPSEASSVVVTLEDGTRFENVSVLGRTSPGSSLDIAFLKIDDLKGKKLTPAQLGDSSKVGVGDKVVAIGNALGRFQNTVTSGIISGYGRDVTATGETGDASRLDDLFQTDAAINQGNSGGPLVNINGEVIGVNTAVAGGAQNIGFAIPINDTKGLIASVLESGELQQPYLGVRYISLTDALAAELGLGIKRGAYIVLSDEGQPSIIQDSPAQKAGLQAGDVIVKANNLNIDDKTSLASALSRFKVGQSVRLEIWRDGKTLVLQATLEAAP